MHKKKIDVIVAFAFGKEEYTNKSIADRVIHIAQFNSRAEKADVFTQKDLQKGILTAEKNCTRKEPRKIDLFVAPQSNIYISTLQIAKEFAKVAQEKRWKNVAVVGHHPHIWRCSRDLKKLGFSVILESWPRNSNWNTNDPQWWVRNKIFWWLREIPLRLLPFWFYKKKYG